MIFMFILNKQFHYKPQMYVKCYINAILEVLHRGHLKDSFHSLITFGE